MWLLLQVKRDTLQATKYVELLLVADYAEVRNGIVFIPTEHWAQSISSAASSGAGRESCVSVPFVLAATTGQGRDADCDLGEG